jgi:hypothetical protein
MASVWSPTAKGIVEGELDVRAKAQQDRLRNFLNEHIFEDRGEGA